MARLQNFGRSEKVFLIQSALPSFCLPGARSPRSLRSSFCLPCSHNPQLWGTLLLGPGLQEVHGLSRPWELVFPETHPQPLISIPKLVPRDNELLAFSPEKGIPALWPSTWVPPTQVCPKYPRPHQLPICSSEVGRCGADTAPGLAGPTWFLPPPCEPQ